MKKIVLVLAVLILATPAMAAVTVKVTQWLGGPGVDDEATIRYEITGTDPNLVRAFALDFDFDCSLCNDTNDVGNVVVTYTDPNYWVYPGSIDVNALTGAIDNYGLARCDPCYPGTLSLADDNGITVEMASLYSPTGGAGTPNAPDPCGILLKFTLDKSCKVNVSENTIRGGVVMEDGTTPASLTLTAGTILVCDADIAGAQYGPKDGKVNKWDMGKILENWKKTPLIDIRADIYGAQYGPPDGKCNKWDMGKVLSNWKKNRTCP